MMNRAETRDAAHPAVVVAQDSGRPGQYQASVLTEAGDLELLASELDVLAERAMEKSVFYEWWMLSAALKELRHEAVMVVIIRHPSYGVTGLFPFQLHRRFRGLPIAVLRSWRHSYCFLCTPLVSGAHVQQTVRALLEWMDSGASPARVMEFDLVAIDGPFWSSMVGEMNEMRGWRRYTISYERAVFHAARGLQTSVSGRHLKNLRRLERKLAAKGVCAYRVWQDGERVDPWIEDFLRLEASGWKGRKRTALASYQSSRAFFMRIAQEASRRRQLQMLAIELDGKPIAMKCNFLTGTMGYAFKIAFDEQYAKYSPGVLLELFNMRNLADSRPDIECMDSCALPQHFMIDRLWAGRRSVATCIVARRGLAALLIRHWPKYARVRKLIAKWQAREIH